MDPTYVFSNKGLIVLGFNGFGSYGFGNYGLYWKIKNYI
jgi:hypothetical protein